MTTKGFLLWGYCIGALFELIEKDISRKDFDRLFELLELPYVPEDIHEYAYGVLLRNAKISKEDILNGRDSGDILSPSKYHGQ